MHVQALLSLIESWGRAAERGEALIGRTFTKFFNGKPFVGEVKLQRETALTCLVLLQKHYVISAAGLSCIGQKAATKHILQRQDDGYQPDGYAVQVKIYIADQKWYYVEYEDDDNEELVEDELLYLLSKTEENKARGAGSRNPVLASKT